MLPRLRPVNTETVARRLKLHPGTVTVEAVRANCNLLGMDADADGHTGLATEAFDLILAAHELRTDVAGAYDRFDSHTAQATEALEILIASGMKLEAADLELRTGNRAA